MSPLTSSMAAVRAHMRERLQPLFVRVFSEDPAKIYISSIGMLCQVRYDNLAEHNLSYDGLYCLVMLNKGNEIVLCHLRLSKLHDLTYEAKEIPIAFTRCPTRSLQIDECQIMGYLLPCLEK